MHVKRIIKRRNEKTIFFKKIIPQYTSKKFETQHCEKEIEIKSVCNDG